MVQQMAAAHLGWGQAPSLDTKIKTGNRSLYGRQDNLDAWI